MKLISKLLFSLIVTTTPIFAADSVFLPDGAMTMVRQATLVGPTDPNKIINIILWLQLRDKKQLDATLQDIYTKGNKQYHHFLTKKQFNSTFLLTDADLNKLKTYLTNQGLTVANHPYPFYLRAKGTAAQIEHAFQIKMNDYRYKNKTYYANATAPAVPKNLAPFISQITGLNTISSGDDTGSTNKCTKDNPLTSPVVQSTDSTNHYEATNTYIAKISQGNVTLPATFTGFIPGGPGGTGYTPSQIQTAYGINTLITQGINGKGQTIRIVDSCISSTLINDYNTFRSQNNFPTANQCNSSSPPTFLSFNPPLDNTTVYCPTTGDAGAEVTLDVEGSSTSAPCAQLIVYWDPTWQTDSQGTGNGDVPNKIALLNAIADSGTWDLISSSHSEPENGFYPPTSGSMFPNVDSNLSSAAAQGISVNVSSGDCGDNVGYANYKQVNYPSSSPWVTAIGATQLFADNNGTYQSEMGWGTAVNVSYSCLAANGSCTTYTPAYLLLSSFNQGFVEGTTGGLSSIYSSNSWQKNAISNIYAGGYGTVGTRRAVPDISYFGESHYPGFECYITPSSCSGSGPCQPSPQSEGGTSLATPFFTGLLALVNQQRQMNGMQTGIGLVAQYLYDLSACSSGCPLRPVTNPHNMGNPVAGFPNPNAFQLFQISDSAYPPGSFTQLPGAYGYMMGIVFNFDSSLTLGQPGDVWNDVTGVGTPYAPVFVTALGSVQ